MKLTDEQIRELCEKATEGPWEWRTVHGPLMRKLPEGVRKWCPDVLGLDITMDGDKEIDVREADAEFIAAARELVPQLLDRAQKAEQVISSIVNLANDGKSVAFAEDWGDNTLTVQVDDAHTHVGAPEGSLGNLIKDLHALFVEGKGLNWVGHGAQEKEGQM